MGSLTNFLHKVKDIDILPALSCFINGVNYLHNDCNIIHQDLHFGNFCVEYKEINNYKIKITDFGMCNKLNYKDKDKSKFYFRDYLPIFEFYRFSEKFKNFDDYNKSMIYKIYRKLTLVIKKNYIKEFDNKNPDPETIYEICSKKISINSLNTYKYINYTLPKKAADILNNNITDIVNKNNSKYEVIIPRKRLI